MFSIKSEITFLIFCAPVISTFVCVLVLLQFYRYSKAKRSMALLLSVVALCMLAYTISDYYIYDTPYEVIRFFDSWSGLLISPFLLYYFSTLIFPDQSHRKQLFTWLLPAIISLPLYILTLSLWGEKTGIYDLTTFYKNLPHPDLILRLLVLLVFTGMIVAIAVRVWNMTKHYQLNLREHYSYCEKINLNWVFYIVGLMILFGALAILGIVTSGFEYKLLFAFATFFIMIQVFMLGVKQADLIQIVEENITSDLEIDKELSKTQKLKQELIEYFENEKPYLDSNLELNKIAAALNTNRTYISRLINMEFDCSFYEFVNKRRAHHALSLITTDDSLLIDVVINESGFKSKATFYKFFRQEFGCTPVKYLQKEQFDNYVN